MMVTTTTTSSSTRSCASSEDLPGLGDRREFVKDPSCGAVATCTGSTRGGGFRGENVTRLGYEGDPSVAERELRTTCADARKRFPEIRKIAAAHILADCPVGRASVVLACSGPHRKDSVRCIEYLIDEIKARVPIRKRKC